MELIQEIMHTYCRKDNLLGKIACFPKDLNIIYFLNLVGGSTFWGAPRVKNVVKKKLDNNYGRGDTKCRLYI